MVKKKETKKPKNKPKQKNPKTKPKESRLLCYCGPFLRQVVSHIVTTDYSLCLGGSQFLIITKSDLCLHFYDLGRQE